LQELAPGDAAGEIGLFHFRFGIHGGDAVAGQAMIS
jgi:hypothetical protein